MGMMQTELTIEAPGLSQLERGVLHVLTIRADDSKGGTAKVSQLAIANILDSHPESTGKAMRKLERVGYITRQKQHIPGTCTPAPSVIAVNYPAIEKAVNEKRAGYGTKQERKRKTISATTRLRIHERDGYQCRWCGSSKRLVIDHIVPFALGGDDSESNWQTLCWMCNAKKGTGPNVPTTGLISSAGEGC